MSSMALAPSSCYRQLHAMLGIYAVLFLLGLETTLGGSVLPQAARALNGFDNFSWLGTCQMLAAASATPITARLGDMWRRKWLVLISVILLCVAGCLAAAAPSMEALLVSRVINGISIGMMAGSAFAVPVDVFSDPARRVRWQSVSGVMFALASSAGPMLGAWLSELFGWRIALLLLPLTSLPVLVMLALMPDFQAKNKTLQRFDWLGAVLMTSFIFTSLYGLQTIGKRYDSWFFLVLAGLCLYFLGRHQNRTPQPILALEVLRNTQVLVITLSTFLTGLILGVQMFYSPLLLVKLMGISYQKAGLSMLPLLLGMPLGSMINGYLFRKLRKPHCLFWLGAFLLAAGSFILVAVPWGLPMTAVWLAYGLCGIGLGVSNQIQGLFILLVTPREFAGAATGLVSTARNYGGALGSAFVGLLLLQFGLAHSFAIVLIALGACALLVLPVITGIKAYEHT